MSSSLWIRIVHTAGGDGGERGGDGGGGGDRSGDDDPFPPPAASGNEGVSDRTRQQGCILETWHLPFGDVARHEPMVLPDLRYLTYQRMHSLAHSYAPRA